MLFFPQDFDIAGDTLVRTADIGGLSHLSVDSFLR